MGESLNEMASLGLHIGDPAVIWADCEPLRLQLDLRWEVSRCNGDAGRFVHGLAQHPNLEGVVRPICAAMAARMRQVPSAVVKLGLTDQHGKHPSVALGALLGCVFRDGGWAVDLHHCSVAYRTNIFCECHRRERQQRDQPAYCPLVKWALEAWWLDEPQWGYRATAQWHLEQSRQLGQAGLNSFGPLMRRILREEGVPC